MQVHPALAVAAILLATSALSCASNVKITDSPPTDAAPFDASGLNGAAKITGAITGSMIASENGVAVADSRPPSFEIKVAAAGLACGKAPTGDHITFDLGASQPGTYTIVKNYPLTVSLSPSQARAHVCGAATVDGAIAGCHDDARSGSVIITKIDPAGGGSVEGSFQLTIADGELHGTFSALRCNN